MSISSDGSTCRIILQENGVVVDFLDGSSAADVSEVIATGSRLPLGQQGSTKEQEWVEANGNIPLAAVSSALHELKVRYRNNVLAKLPTNLSVTFDTVFPNEGTERRTTYFDIKFTELGVEFARGADTMYKLPWTCGNPPVEG